MPRKVTKKLQRKLNPDRKYQSVLVQRLINKSMLDGKKHIAEKAVYSALELAAKKLAKWKAMRSRPVAYMKEDGQFDAVLMPQRPDDDVEVLAGPMPSTDLAKWIENYVLAVGGGPAT